MMRARRRPGWIAAASVALGLSLLASATGALAATKSVSIQNYAFTPSSVSIHVGDTVTWTNNESQIGGPTHTVTADGGAFGSGDLTPGRSFSFTFTRSGSFPYHCSIHTFMTGTITVTSTTTSPPPSVKPTPTHSRPKPTATATAKPTVVPVSPTPTSSVKPSPRASKSAASSTPAAPSPSPSRVVAAGSSSSGPGVALPVIAGLLIVLVALGGFALRARKAHR